MAEKLVRKQVDDDAYWRMTFKRRAQWSSVNESAMEEYTTLYGGTHDRDRYRAWVEEVRRLLKIQKIEEEIKALRKKLNQAKDTQ